MVTQLQDSARQPAQGKTCLRQRLSAQMKYAAKFSLMPATVCVMKKSKILYTIVFFLADCLHVFLQMSVCSLLLLSACLSLCLSVCLPVCLCACLFMQASVILLLRTFDIRYSEWSLVQVFQKVFNIFNDLDPLYAFYFVQQLIFYFFLKVN